MKDDAGKRRHGKDGYATLASSDRGEFWRIQVRIKRTFGVSRGKTDIF